MDGCRELELGAPVAVGDVFDAKHICDILCNCWCSSMQPAPINVLNF